MKVLFIGTEGTIFIAFIVLSDSNKKNQVFHSESTFFFLSEAQMYIVEKR